MLIVWNAYLRTFAYLDYIFKVTAQDFAGLTYNQRMRERERERERESARDRERARERDRERERERRMERDINTRAICANTQPIAFEVSFNFIIQSQSNWSLFQ